MITGRSGWPVLLMLLVVLAGLALRVEAVVRPGLWSDEIFSLAMATGHSLEHPAATADTVRGDFVEPRAATLPAALRRYAEVDDRPAGAGRVIRAVLLSDTSPPLYYLLLNRWTRWFGVGDSALRAFSLLCAALSLPLLWLLGRELGGPSVAWTACVLFSASPVAVYYSAEGRMYALLWCLALALAWATLRLARGERPWHAVLWVAAGVAGLLTHYFFAFVWIGCVAWLALRHRSGRRRLAVAAAITVLAILPWYLRVPESLERWRVSGTWLQGELPWPGALGRPFALAGSLGSGSSLLGGWRWADHVAMGIAVLVLLWLARAGAHRRLFSGGSLLVWGWLAAVCIGPLVFDLFRHTTTSLVDRYALAGLPAVMLLASLAVSQLPPVAHAGVLLLLLAAWLPGDRKILRASTPRPWEPYPTLAARLEAWARPGDLVLARSIPSGVLGVARYLEDTIPLAAWVPQLGTRTVPDDIERLLRGRRRLAVARIHDLGAQDSLEAWLRQHARPLGRDSFRGSRAEVTYYGPLVGNTFLLPSTSH